MVSSKTMKSNDKNFEKNILFKAFVNEYIKDLNSTKAAVRAGYKNNEAEKKGKLLLENPEIIKEIKNTIKKQVNKLQIEKAYIIEKLLSIIEFSLESEEVFDKSGNPTGNFKIRDLGSGFKALEILGKYLGFFDSKNAADAVAEPRINTIVNLNAEKI